MVNKTQTIGWSGTILILLVIAGATIFTDDYRQMLIDNPAATYIMLDYAENEKIEFITRGISDFLDGNIPRTNGHSIRGVILDLKKTGWFIASALI